MSVHIWSKAILDADFAIKLGRIKKCKVIEELLPIYVENLLIPKPKGDLFPYFFYQFK